MAPSSRGRVTDPAVTLTNLRDALSALSLEARGHAAHIFTEESKGVATLLGALFDALSAGIKDDGVIFVEKGHVWDYIRMLGTCVPHGDEYLNEIDAIDGLTTMTAATRAFLCKALNGGELHALVAALAYNQELTRKHYTAASIFLNNTMLEDFLALLKLLEKGKFKIALKASFLQAAAPSLPAHVAPHPTIVLSADTEEEEEQEPVKVAHLPVKKESPRKTAKPKSPRKTASPRKEEQPTQKQPEPVDEFRKRYEAAELEQWKKTVGDVTPPPTVDVIHHSGKMSRRGTRRSKHRRSLSAHASPSHTAGDLSSSAGQHKYTITLEEALNGLQLPGEPEPLPARSTGTRTPLSARPVTARPPVTTKAPRQPSKVPTLDLSKTEAEEESKEESKFWSPRVDPFTGKPLASPRMSALRRNKDGRKTGKRRRSNSAPHDVAYQRRASQVAIERPHDHLTVPGSCDCEADDSSSEEDIETLDLLGSHLRKSTASFGTRREVELILTVPKHSHPTEHMVCYSCFQTVEENEEARFCHYTGKYYCTECHLQNTSIIPGRVLESWDFRSYEVSEYGRDCIAELYTRPVVTPSPHLLSLHPDLPKIKSHRKQLRGMWGVVEQCRGNTAVIEDYFGSREYILTDKNVSLKDLVEVNNGTAFSFLVGGISVLTEHIHRCPMCLDRGLVCVKCLNKDDKLFVFDSQRAEQCKLCKAIFHQTCADEVCPSCDAHLPVAQFSEANEDSFIIFDEPEHLERLSDSAAGVLRDRLVLVIGATSDLGMELVKQLVKSAVKVRAMTRNSRSFRSQELSDLGVEVVHYDDPSEEQRLEQAMRGCYALFSIIRDGFWVAGSLADGTDVCQGPQGLILEVAERLGVKRVVYCLYGAITAENEMMHSHAHRSRGALEKYMWLNCETAWTVVRPAMLMEALVQPRYQPKYHWTMFRHHMQKNQRQLPLIGLHDLANFLREALCEQHRFVREVMDVAGDCLAFDEAATEYELVLGTPVPCHKVALPLWLLSVIHPHLVAAAGDYQESDFSADAKAVRAKHPYIRAFADYLSDSLLPSLPPRWVDDSETKTCQQCSAPFTLTKRRHHCRNCGQVLCKKCTSHSASLPWYNIDKPSRICSQCYVDHLDQILAENRRPAWEADDVSKDCQNCGTTFSLLTRKHHCRNCGRLLCSDCTPHMAGIPKYHIYNPVRICRECYARSTVIQLGALYKIQHNPISTNASVGDLRSALSDPHPNVNPTTSPGAIN